MEGQFEDIRAPKRRTRLKAIAAFGTLVAVFCAGLYLGVHEALLRAQTATGTGIAPVNITIGSAGQPSNVDLSQFWQTWAMLQQDFVQAHASGTIPTDQQKVYGAIAGLVNSYGDPYTVFFPPSDAQVFNQDVAGSFGGVGMEVGSDDQGNLIVIAPLKGSPAAKAGIQAGDRIVSIDTTSSEKMSPDDAVKIIRGPIGTTVKITVARSGQSQPIVIPIVRQTIVIPTIDYKDDGKGIYEIDLYNFSAGSANDFRTALRGFIQSGDHKLLLDLRGNPGGYLDAAVDMASYFLPQGSVVVTEDFRGKQDNIIDRSLGYNVFANHPIKMAILMDRGTASAAEILSGALEQHGVAKLVGTRSFGKGSVQELLNLGGGAELKITVARWLTPNGTSISDGGLTPDINATTTADNLKAHKDPQKAAAIQYLQTQ